MSSSASPASSAAVLLPDLPPALAERLRQHEWDCSLDRQVAPLFLALQWAQARSLAGMRPVLARHGCTAAEFDVLATLRNAPPPFEMTPGAIQAETVITSGGLTKVLSQLEARDLISRPPREGDQRIKPVRLTTTGQVFIETALSAAIAETGDWLRGRLSESEMAQLTALLGRLLG